MKRFCLAVAIVLASVASPAGAAIATKGLLGVGANPSFGIVDPDGGVRYTAIAAGPGTAVASIDTRNGRLGGYTYLNSRLVVPAVAYDGSPGGLSADGEKLVLAEPETRFPRERSDFTVLDSERLRIVDQLSLEGTYSYDAISPDGRSLYLIEYTSPRDPTEYLVREYDLARDRFNPKPIIDPNESGEDMYGTPVTRSTSPDGRWEYTLYDGREHPFIHALDVERGAAVCIDLEELDRIVYGATGLEPSADGTSLTVVDGHTPVEIVDTKTFEVEPATPAEPAASAAAVEPESGAEGADDSDPLAWIVLAGGVALLALAGGLSMIRRGSRAGVDDAQFQRLVASERASTEVEEEREHDPVR